MNNNIIISAGWFLPLVLLTGIFLVGCGERDSDQDDGKPGYLVKTVVVGDKQDSAKRYFPGRVVASKKMELSFAVPGRVLELLVKDGEEVNEAQLLARLDPRDYKTQLDETNSSLYKSTQQYNRGVDLVASGTISQNTFDEVKADYDAALARSKTAQKIVAATYLNAPFSGSITKTFVENSADVQANQPIVTLQDLKYVNIVVDIPAQFILTTKNKKNDERWFKDAIVFPAIPGRLFDVQLLESTAETKPAAKTYQLTVAMPVPKDVEITTGMPAKFIIYQKNVKSEESYLIPNNAVTMDQQGAHSVWSVDMTAMTVHQKPIEVGSKTGEFIHVLSGINSGEVLVSETNSHLEDGMKIRVKDKP